ncbi:MAG: helix-turn-helix domain-containing protein [bacterium]
MGNPVLLKKNRVNVTSRFVRDMISTRESKGISQSRLSKLTGVQQGSLSALENGKIKSLTKIGYLSIMNALGMKDPGKESPTVSTIKRRLNEQDSKTKSIFSRLRSPNNIWEGWEDESKMFESTDSVLNESAKEIELKEEKKMTREEFQKEMEGKDTEELLRRLNSLQTKLDAIQSLVILMMSNLQDLKKLN